MIHALRGASGRLLILGAGLAMGLDVLTAETHGMAQRGGTVLSTVKIGPFHSPLIRRGEADVALLLHADNLEVHRPYLRTSGRLFVGQASSMRSRQRRFVLSRALWVSSCCLLCWVAGGGFGNRWAIGRPCH